MKIGVSIRPLVPVEKDAQELLEDLFAELDDFKDIELHTEYLDRFEIFFLNLIRTRGVSYSIHCPHGYSKIKLNLCSSVKEDIKTGDLWLKKSIDYAKRLDAKYIVLHPDKPIKCSQEKALDILEAHIKKAIKSLGKNQVLLIENMPSDEYALSTPEEFQDFLARFPSQVALCWDVGHEVQRFKDQEFRFPKVLGEKIREVHISGIVNFHDHEPLTRGDLKLKNCIQALKKADFSENIIFEIVTKNPLDITESKKMIDKLI